MEPSLRSPRVGWTRFDDSWSAWDTSSYDSSYDDAWSSYETYSAAEDLSWAAWNQSVDASVAGDAYAAYEWNSISLDAGAVADDAWTEWVAA